MIGTEIEKGEREAPLPGEVLSARESSPTPWTASGTSLCKKVNV